MLRGNTEQDSFSNKCKNYNDLSYIKYDRSTTGFTTVNINVYPVLESESIRIILSVQNNWRKLKEGK